MCETANQQSISSHMVVYMACKMRCRWLTLRRCFVNRALSRNRSLRDAKPARHLFVWFAKHCLAEHCLSFRVDAHECEKQFCFVFRICLAVFDSRLWRPLVCAGSIANDLIACRVMASYEDSLDIFIWSNVCNNYLLVCALNAQITSHLIIWVDQKVTSVKSHG